LTSNEIFTKTVQHIGEYLEHDVSNLRPESELATLVPGLDSLKSFEMLLYLEDCFNVEFEETLLSRLKVLQDLVDYIAARLESEKGSASIAV
jgi:acyl carrier protein